jgi:folate-dependent tRNA-U54 methylase TrmFO/GidA
VVSSRYDKGEGADYANCPLDRAEYEGFVAALRDGETIQFRDWGKTAPYFDGCLPIEVMAARGSGAAKAFVLRQRSGSCSATSPAAPTGAVSSR